MNDIFTKTYLQSVNKNKYIILQQVDQIDIDDKKFKISIDNNGKITFDYDKNQNQTLNLTNDQIDDIKKSIPESEIKKESNLPTEMSTFDKSSLIISQSVSWLIDGTGKIISFPTDYISNFILKKYYTFKQENCSSGETINSVISKFQANKKQATQSDLNTLDKKYNDLYELLKNNQNILFYNPKSGSLWKNINNIIYYYIYNKLLHTVETADIDTLNKAVQDAKIKQENGEIGKLIPGAKESKNLLKKRLQNQISDLKFQDEAEESNFLMLILNWFLDQLQIERPVKYIDYSDQQLRGFSKTINKMIQDGTIKPGYYTFTYEIN